MASNFRKFSNFHRKVRDQANRLFRKYINAKLIPKASGSCVDCGAQERLCYDHRDYSEALTADVVCSSCNNRRGPAVIPFINVETLETIRYREFQPMSKARISK